MSLLRLPQRPHGLRLIRRAVATGAALVLPIAAGADVRVTSLSAPTTASATASDITVEGFNTVCSSGSRALPPLSEMTTWEIPGSSQSCREDSQRRFPVYSAQARVEISSGFFGSAGLTGPIGAIGFFAHAGIGNDRAADFSASSQSSFSVTFLIDTPTYVRVTIMSAYAQGGPGSRTLTTTFPGVTIPSLSETFPEAITDILVQPGTYTVSGGANSSFSGQGGAAHSIRVHFSFKPLPRRPVFLIPGIGATYASTPSLDSLWLVSRGALPWQLRIDPLSRAYHDLLQSLRNAGYVENRDLFVVNYDWRLSPGPDDGVIDGRIGGLTAPEISRHRYRYGVDYLGDLLRQVQEQWTFDYPALGPLDAVDVIAHSTGGLVARTYIQSAAYRGEYDPGRPLPGINNLIMIGVPNRGASKAWNPLHDNWIVDPAFQVVLSKIVNRAYQKVLQGAIVRGPDHDISLATLQGPACQPAPKVCFINLYVPTARALLATYDFVDFGAGLTNVNEDLTTRNSLVLDLNAGLDLANATGDPNAFADDATVTVMYGTNGGDTPTQVVRAVGPGPVIPLPGSRPIAGFTDFIARTAGFGEVYYRDITHPDSGDGTVPLESSIGQFLFDPRVRLLPFTEGGNTTFSVKHVDLMFNPDVQRAVLQTLSASFDDPQDLSTGLAGVSLGVPCAITGCLNFILDPVEGFVVDGSGRRLGFTTATGARTEIPGSIWFGGVDGIGWIFGPIQEPLSVQLTGLGGYYYVQVSRESVTGATGVTLEGVLLAGEPLAVPIPATVTNQPPSAAAGSDRMVRQGSLVTLAGSAQDPDAGPAPVTLAWAQAGGPAVTLTGAATATPVFTAVSAGQYTFTLVAFDGAAGSAADSISVIVPPLGDIDLDGDVDSADLTLLLARRNTAADHANDLRDLNASGRIDALDSRKLSLLCTRARCAVQ